MKITQKLYLFIVLTLMLVMLPYSIIAYQREVALFKADMQKDASLLGRALLPILADTWQTIGKVKVDEVIRQVNAHEEKFSVRWVWLLPQTDEQYRPLVPLEMLVSLTQAEQVLAVEQRDTLVTYVTVKPDNQPLGALELVESLDGIRAYTTNSILNLFILSSFMVFSGALVMAIAGHLLITRRINLLIGHARDIAQEQYDRPPNVGAIDELATLGQELRLMSDKLQQKREQLIAENQAKLAIKEQLRHAERLKILGQLASGIAHELGTPLNVVLGRAKLMTAAGQHNEAVKSNADIIQKQVLKMSKMINQLLNFARRQTPHKRRVVLNERVAHLVKLLKPIAAKQEIELVVIDKVSELSINADWQQLEQVLSNLIVNGIQAMSKAGEMTVIIDQRSGEDAELSDKPYAVIEVCDQGAGIPCEIMADIFDPFFSTKKAGEGTGLGLSIVKDIIDEHGGSITVKSEPHQGACFSLYLPME